MSQTANVNIVPDYFSPILHASQYDVGREFVISLVDSSGNYNIPAGATVELVGTKPSGFGFTLTGVVSSNKVTFTTTATVTAEHGRIPCEVRITAGGDIIGTANIIMDVEVSPHPEGTTDGDAEIIINTITALVNQAQDIADSIHALTVTSAPLTAGDAPTLSYDTDTNTLDFGLSTANSIERIVLTSTVGAVKTYTITFTDGTTTTFSVTDGEVTEASLAAALADYAKTDGYYENMGSGYADNLATDIRAASQVPYGFQTAGGSVDIGDREYLNAVVGGSLPINQIAKFHNSITYDGITSEFDSDTGTLTMNGTTTNANYFYILGSPQSLVNCILNHVYYCKMDDSNVYTFEGIKLNVTGACIGKFNGNGALGYLRIYGASGGVGKTIDRTCKPQIIDLTLLLGSQIADYINTLESGTAGAGVAWCKAHFPKIFNSGYIAYNAGTMEHVTGVSSHDTVGFNQWDEVAENGGINSSGGNYSDATKIRSKNYVPVLPNTTYYVKCPSTMTILAYDANKTVIRKAWSGYDTITKKDTTLAIPDGVHYIRFYLSGIAYNHDICINLAWDNSRNGEFESYIKRTYPLDPSLTLRGVPKLDASNNLYYDGDRYTPDGNVNHIMSVDLGLNTLTWQHRSDIAQGLFSTNSLSDYKLSSSVACVCNKYVYRGAVASAANATSADKSLFVYYASGSSQHALYIYDTAYSDKDTFTASLSGVYLTYELATPTTESADPFQQVQIVDDFGTEEFVTTGLVPVGHQSEYPVNLKAKLEMTPNSPSGNGDYVLQQSSGVNTYVDLGATNTITGIIGRIEALEALHQ